MYSCLHDFGKEGILGWPSMGLGGGLDSPGTMGMSPSPHHRNQKNRRTPFSLIMSEEPQIKNKGRGSSLRLMFFWGKKCAMLPRQGWFLVTNINCGHKQSWQRVCACVEWTAASPHRRAGRKRAGLLPDSIAVQIVHSILGTHLVLPSIISEASF